MFESEERRIVRRIKEGIKNVEPPRYYYIMLKNGHILYINDYHYMVNSGKINPKDAHVYIRTYVAAYKAELYYPFLEFYNDLLFAYLSKLGFHNWPSIASATGLKYVAFAFTFHPGNRGYMSIELVNLDTAVNNTNLRKIVFEVLGEKLVSGEKELTYREYYKIHNIYKTQQLFAGYNVEKAWNIIKDYYDEGNQSLSKDVARIAMDYYRTFNPYTVCYDTRTWKEVDCLQIELD